MDREERNSQLNDFEKVHVAAYCLVVVGRLRIKITYGSGDDSRELSVLYYV